MWHVILDCILEIMSVKILRFLHQLFYLKITVFYHLTCTFLGRVWAANSLLGGSLVGVLLPLAELHSVLHMCFGAQSQWVDGVETSPPAPPFVNSPALCRACDFSAWLSRLPMARETVGFPCAAGCRGCVDCRRQALSLADGSTYVQSLISPS